MPRFVLLLLLGLVTIGTVSFAPDARATDSGTVRIVGITGGPYFTCALPDGPGVYCWGDAYDGGLGNGVQPADERWPAHVMSLRDTNIAAIGAGDYHVCVASDAGQVMCWGRNISGQLGNGTFASSFVPAIVSGLSGTVVQVDGGWNHTCALTDAGDVYCWGNNEHGQLGNGTISLGQNVPSVVAGLSGPAIDIAMGSQSSCAVIVGGTVQCWGANHYGQLGDGTTFDSWTPVTVANLTDAGVVQAIGLSACALDSSGGVECWGNNEYGQVGDGTRGDGDPGTDDNFRTTPIGVVGLQSGVAHIATGFWHSCALMAAGNVQCWGDNVHGQIGNQSIPPPDLTVPTDVLMLDDDVVLIGAGYESSCAVSSDGTTKCWGGNRSGNGTYNFAWLPVDVLFDADGDGCPDGAELQTAPGSQAFGGQRDPKSPWDFFDPTGDGRHRIDDVLAVVRQYYVDQGNAGYSDSSDRTLLGPNAWNLGPPNGLQRIDDVLNAIRQYFHDCVDDGT